LDQNVTPLTENYSLDVIKRIFNYLYDLSPKIMSNPITARGIMKDALAFGGTLNNSTALELLKARQQKESIPDTHEILPYMLTVGSKGVAPYVGLYSTPKFTDKSKFSEAIKTAESKKAKELKALLCKIRNARKARERMAKKGVRDIL
jgi:hypothetical protein